MNWSHKSLVKEKVKDESYLQGVSPPSPSISPDSFYFLKMKIKNE